MQLAFTCGAIVGRLWGAALGLSLGQLGCRHLLSSLEIRSNSTENGNQNVWKVEIDARQIQKKTKQNIFLLFFFFFLDFFHWVSGFSSLLNEGQK
jgi:hypothetical protein